MAESRITPFLTTWRVIIHSIYQVIDQHTTIPNVFFACMVGMGFAIIAQPQMYSIQAIESLGIKGELYGALFVMVGAGSITAGKTLGVLIFGQSIMWLHTLWVMWYLLLNTGNPAGLPIPAYLGLCLVMAIEARRAYREH